MGNPDIAALADDFWEHYLETNPTEAHLLGDYRYAGGVGGREPRGRGPRRSRRCARFADRAEAIDAERPRATRSG